MSRSIWKAPFSGAQLDKLPGKARRTPIHRFAKPGIKEKVQKPEKQVWSRASTILPDDLGKQVQVYNGKNWIKVQITEEMIAHKYGEFASTRKRSVHKSKGSARSG